MHSGPLNLSSQDDKEGSQLSKQSHSSVFRGAYEISKHEHLSLIKLRSKLKGNRKLSETPQDPYNLQQFNTDS